MSDADNKNACEEFQILMMGFIDGELNPEDEKRFKKHAYPCPHCAEELAKYQKLAELTDSLQMREPSDYECERIYKSIFYRIESRFGWFFAITGALIILAYGLYELCVDWEMTAWLRVGIVMTLVGFILLLLSAARRRRRIKKYERYEAVKR